METEKMIKKSDDQGYYITNFGAIAAARNLNNFDDLARKAIRIIRYKGLNKLTTEKEFPGEKEYAIGFHELIQLLRASLPESEVIRDAFRQEESVYPENALRELIANALIHQDFTIRGKSPKKAEKASNPAMVQLSKIIPCVISNFYLSCTIAGFDTFSQY